MRCRPSAVTTTAVPGALYCRPELWHMASVTHWFSWGAWMQLWTAPPPQPEPALYHTSNQHIANEVTNTGSAGLTFRRSPAWQALTRADMAAQSRAETSSITPPAASHERLQR